MSKQVNIDIIQGFAGATVETFEQMASMVPEPKTLCQTQRFLHLGRFWRHGYYR